MTFELHPSLAQKAFITDLPLCRVLFEDNINFPWIFLIPRRPTIKRIMDLNEEDQIQLLHEIDIAQHVMWDLFQPTQLNVAAIGNKTPQLHIHVIARSENDPAWPGTVWDNAAKEHYAPDLKTQTIERIKNALQERIKS